MNPLYREILVSSAHADAFEKLASTSKGDSLVDKGMAEDVLYAKLQKYAEERFLDASLPRKDGVALAMIKCAIELRDTHEAALGVKIAAFEEHGDLLQKIATAAFVDTVLSEQLEKCASDETLQVRRLGREYAMNLVRGLLA